MPPRAKLSDLIDCLGWESEEYRAYFDRETGQVVMGESYILDAIEGGDEEALSEAGELENEALETARAIVAGRGGRFIDPPDKFDFHEYRQMERFIESLSDAEAAEQLWRAIKGRGAFRCFKDTLHRLGIQEHWYRHRDEAMKEFVIHWAEANEVAYEDDTRKPGA